MRFLVCIVCLLPAYSYSQNLLVNPGFEEENICSEYAVNCAPEGWLCSLPSFSYYFNEPLLAHQGSKFITIIAGHSQKPFYRTFVRSRLLCGLQKGKIYRLELFLKSLHPILDSIGIYFSSYDFLFEKQVYQKIIPSLYIRNANTKMAKGDTAWQRIVFNYKANGNEDYITIGNFSKRGLGGMTGIYKENNFFVLIDDISLVPIDVNERLCLDWKKRKDEIYAQNERHEYLETYIKTNKTKSQVVKKVTPTITLHIDTLVMPDVFFATNSFMLNTKAIALLDSFSRKMNQYKLDSINIYGHTDSRGTETYNKELSWRRANSVAAYLEKKVSAKIQSEGIGSDKPVADNRTAEGRRRNRRVEIYLYIKD